MDPRGPRGPRQRGRRISRRPRGRHHADAGTRRGGRTPLLADGPVALFVGASLTATSIGITARVFSDLGRLVTREAQIVLAAAIFDDVVGLILLSVLVSLAGEGVVSIPSIAITVVLALVFVLGSIVIGARSWRRLVPLVHRLRVRGVLLVFAFALALALSGVAAAIGLATIIGAFAAVPR